VGFIIEVVVAISLAGYLLMRGRSDTSGGEEQSKLPQILIIFLVCYVGLLLLTITFLEIDNVLDSRSLLRFISLC